MSLLKMAVPTTTILAQNPNNPQEVCVLRSTGKHGKKLILPGGKVKVGLHNHLQTGVIELAEEVGLKIHSPQIFCISDRPQRDIRVVSIEKVADGNPVPPELKGMMVEAYHCFDVAFYGWADGEPQADGKEGSEAFWYDLRKLSESDFAIDHGRLAHYFKMFLDTGILPKLGTL